MSYPTISDEPSVQSFYEQMRGEGQSHSIAELCALRQAPGSMTDRELFEGIGTLDKQFDGAGDQLDYVVGEARKKGYNPNPNDFYCAALANSPGDPLAFVPATGGRGHIRRVIESRGQSCEGAVNVKAPTRDPGPATRLAGDLVDKTVRKMVKKDPSLTKASRSDQRAEAISKHGQK